MKINDGAIYEKKINKYNCLTCWRQITVENCHGIEKMA